MGSHSIALLHAHALLRRSLARLLAESGPYHILFDAADPPAFKRACALGAQPHLVLLCWDSATADNHGMLHWVAAHLSTSRVLVLGHDAPVDQLLHTLRAGAHGYHPTNEGPEALCRVMHLLLENAVYFPPAVWKQLHTQLHAPAADVKRPSPTHCIFLSHVAAADSPNYQEIARRMKKSERAVEKYRCTLFARYGIKGKAGLVKLAMQLGLA